MAEDFLQFLGNLVKTFPSLSERPLYLMGESYAGVYIVVLLIACNQVFTDHRISLILLELCFQPLNLQLH
jgi:carboxypeptidase C (cathepsin A)